MSWTDPRTWLAGERLTAALLNEQLRDNLKELGDAWTSYNPTWAAAGTAVALGNGTVTGSFIEAGNLILWKFLVTSGTTTTYGTGNYSISLPQTGVVLFPYPVGDIIGLSSGSVYHEGALHGTGSSTVVGASYAGSRWSATVPFTPGAGAVNRWAGMGMYEAA